MRALVSLLGLVACGGGSGGDDVDDIPLCTPEEQGVTGTALQVDQIQYEEPSGSCVQLLLSSTNELNGHFNGTPPASLTGFDFAVNRLYLGTSNPVVQFAVDTGGTIVIAEEPLCQGIAPSCVAYVLHDTVGDARMNLACPYRGPDPCLAP